MPKRLFEILQEVDIEKVSRIIISEYPEQECNLGKYQELYLHLLDIDPCVPDFIIMIDRYHICGEWATDVCGVVDYKSYSLSFTPWDEWLGAIVVRPGYGRSATIAHCMYYMSYWGFTEEEIAVVASEFIAERVYV